MKYLARKARLWAFEIDGREKLVRYLVLLVVVAFVCTYVNTWLIAIDPDKFVKERGAQTRGEHLMTPIE